MEIGFKVYLCWSSRKLREEKCLLLSCKSMGVEYKVYLILFDDIDPKQSWNHSPQNPQRHSSQ